MGFFDFLKKKESNVSVQDNDFSNLKIPELGNLNTDLPPITAPPDMPLSSQPQIGSNQPQPQMPDLRISSDVAPIDFTLPSLDNAYSSAQIPTLPNQDAMQPLPQKPATPLTLPVQVPVQTKTLSLSAAAEKIDVDLNQLFLKDNSWKEPDTDNFEPYHYDKIEQPLKEDFERPPATLPEFNQKEQIQQEAVRVKEPPVQLFVKGDDYRKIFSELDNINSNLNVLDPRLNFVDSLVKGEDEEYIRCKDYLDFMYKKMVYIDKKIFVGGNYG
jgi:hypothetical protein